MSKPGLKRFILLFENRQIVAISAERFKLDKGVEFYDQHGDCIAAAPSDKLLLVTEEDRLEDLDESDAIEEMGDEELEDS
ncbi:MAG: hypothetical protein GC160_08990 [Acidobacteria bacterium]|nr:hypothetical protein [Acidobacteriota bacterium]